MRLQWAWYNFYKNGPAILACPPTGPLGLGPLRLMFHNVSVSSNCKFRPSIFAGLLPCVASIALALLSGNCEAEKLEKVTLQLKWKHQFQFAGYYAAVAKGFYQEAGLEVALVEAKSGEPYVDPVLNGQAEFGVASSELVVLRAQGKPVVALAPIYQHSPLVLIVGGDSGIDNVHELVGKRVMIAPEEAELFAYFEAEGLDTKSLQIIPHEYSPRKLLAGEVDAVSGYSTDEPFDLDAEGFHFSLFRPRSGGIDFYADTLFTTEQQIREHPDRVKRFLDASLKGWRYAFEHTDEIVDLILTKYAPDHSRAHLEFEAEESRRLIQPELVEIGYTNPGRWENIAQVYARLGMIGKNWNPSGFIYDRDPRPDYRWLINALAVSLAATMAVTGLALYLHRLNQTNKNQARELRELLDDISKLRGILPICGYCKKIRDDAGAWNELEHYIAEHSEAEFSHGICTDCYAKVRSELEAGRKAKAAISGPGNPIC